MNLKPDTNGDGQQEPEPPLGVQLILFALAALIVALFCFFLYTVGWFPHPDNQPRPTPTITATPLPARER